MNFHSGSADINIKITKNNEIFVGILDVFKNVFRLLNFGGL